MFAHNVYFRLKDHSPAARAALVKSCQTYLTSHPGTRFFACGTLAETPNRPVNVRDWDVALHLVFDTETDHDRYQAAPRHQQFIAENKENWAEVRVFDSDVEGGPAG